MFCTTFIFHEWIGRSKEKQWPAGNLFKIFFQVAAVSFSLCFLIIRVFRLSTSTITLIEREMKKVAVLCGHFSFVVLLCFTIIFACFIWKWMFMLLLQNAFFFSELCFFFFFSLETSINRFLYMEYYTCVVYVCMSTLWWIHQRWGQTIDQPLKQLKREQKSFRFKRTFEKTKVKERKTK